MLAGRNVHPVGLAKRGIMVVALNSAANRRFRWPLLGKTQVRSILTTSLKFSYAKL